MKRYLSLLMGLQVLLKLFFNLELIAGLARVGLNNACFVRTKILDITKYNCQVCWLQTT
jgi:hypothetical protein